MVKDLPFAEAAIYFDIRKVINYKNELMKIENKKNVLFLYVVTLFCIIASLSIVILLFLLN
jgi:hypothetical protein